MSIVDEGGHCQVKANAVENALAPKEWRVVKSNDAWDFEPLSVALNELSLSGYEIYSVTRNSDKSHIVIAWRYKA